MEEQKSAVGDNTNPQPSPNQGAVRKNWLIALLLSIFLGGLGIDRFYLGNIGLGLLKLFTTGLFGILYVVDIILIATRHLKGVEWVD